MGKSLALTQVQVLTPSTHADREDSHFGHSVAVHGGTIVVGEPGRDLARKGGATMFARAGDAWVEQAQIAPADLRADDEFGSVVAVQGDTALVSAPRRRVGHVRNAGTVWVYVRKGGAWKEQARLTSPTAKSGEPFGHGLAIQGDEAFVGDDEGVRAYRRQGKTWSLTATVTGPGASVVSVHGDTLVFNQGRDLLVFTRTGAGWTKQQTLSLPVEPEPFANATPRALAFGGQTIVAGVPNAQFDVEV
jgi:hypothetical protein